MTKMMKQAVQFLFVGLALVLATSAFAQQGAGRANPGGKPKMSAEERAKMMTDRQKENLGLTDEQYKKVLEINTNHALKHEGQRAEAQKAREERQAMAQKIEESREAELRKVLNDEQFAKLQQNKQQMKEKAQERKTQGPPPRGKGPWKG